jgi:hypothetical protein
VSHPVAESRRKGSEGMVNRGCWRLRDARNRAAFDEGEVSTVRLELATAKTRYHIGSSLILGAGVALAGLLVLCGVFSGGFCLH